MAGNEQAPNDVVLAHDSRRETALQRLARLTAALTRFELAQRERTRASSPRAGLTYDWGGARGLGDAQS